jgi:hypothetical protein
MSSHEDYFLDRAEEEDDKAREADSEAARDAHHRLATLYRSTALICGPRSLNEDELATADLFII